MISIVSLIYKSTVFADAVRDSLYEFTPMLHSGEAEFFFVANDATPRIIEHLRRKQYPFIDNRNPFYSQDELFARGIGHPEYIARTYMGWNVAVKNSKEIVVLVCSDNLFAPNWLENLVKHLRENRNLIVCCQLVERKHPRFDVFPGAIHAEFGTHPSNYDKAGFIALAAQMSRPGLRAGGAYMPCAFYRDEMMKRVGLFPEGNLHNGRDFFSIQTYGDEDYFKRAGQAGIAHVTSLDSFSYHFKEGEKDE